MAVVPSAPDIVVKNIAGSMLCIKSREPCEQISQWIKSLNIAIVDAIVETANHLKTTYSTLLIGLAKVSGRMPSFTSLPMMPAPMIMDRILTMQVESISGVQSKYELHRTTQSTISGNRKMMVTNNILTGRARNCLIVNRNIVFLTVPAHPLHRFDRRIVPVYWL